jgi:TolB-like protein/DNA-binding winged helix-turn-helix (wHTH) protein
MEFESYIIGDLLLDAGTQEVKRNGVVIPIPRLSFKLLLSLARHAPNVVSAEELEKEVWEGLIVDRGTVNKRVLLLRKSLSEEKAEDPYIAVIRGSGYRLIADVKRVDSPSGESSHEGGGQQTPIKKRRAIRNASYWVLGIVTVLALYNGFQIAASKKVDAEDIGTVEGQVQAVAQFEKTSIAVLPFADLSESKAYQYIGDGIAEEVINLLASMGGLEVAARTSSFAFRSSSLTAVEIAPRLRAGTILEGSIRYSDGRIRVSAQLIDAQTGYQVWSQNYDRVNAEIFEVQDDIALNIAETLKLTLDESSRISSRTSAPGNIEAFELYLKGRELFNDRIRLRAKGLHEALKYFSKSAEKDPGFAKAHASIALVSRLLTSYDDSLNKQAYLDAAETSANIALELDQDSIDALSALALIEETRGNIANAVAMYDRISLLGRKESNSAHWSAMLHIRLGYFDELIEPLTEIHRLEPFNEHIGWTLATAYNFSGDPKSAAKVLKGLKHFSYRDYVLGLCAINDNDFALARSYLRDVRMRSGQLPAVFADLLIDGLEDPAILEDAAQQVLLAVETGELTELVGFEALLILGSPHVFDLGIDPLSDILRLQIHTQIWNNWAIAVRQDPRFKDWVKALGNAEFWREHGWPDRCKPTGPDDFECI